MSGHGALDRMFAEIEAAEIAGDYARRNRQILICVGLAVAAGIEVGFRIDYSEPEWPVVYFELETGQVSWHLPQHVKPWDGHDTRQKWARIRALPGYERRRRWPVPM